ncbi:Ppx/GppA family phosphatase [Sphingomonas parva]|uniref:Ppx/GppA family phosphatase n=1 Tax=Sphingomonas parva TaxID=2555898 RepID=UPI001CDB928C|nr:Ppx/GppA family phosphatase [Sphingomonas parva]
MPHTEPVAIVDIGSNSVRLVVYSGSPRIPSIIFNEKVLAGLGASLAKTGRLGEEAQERALEAMRRFRLLIGQMDVKRTRVVATAAARDAENGDAFLDRIRALGFDPEVISGEMEGILAGEGVLSGIPEAEGVIGDLGGGSLELAEVGGGKVGRSVSLPLGVLRIGEPNRKAEARVRATLREALEDTGLGARGRGRPFYMVGGSWRALARLDLIATNYPLAITHQYRMAPSRPEELRKMIRLLDKADPRSIPTLTASRIPTLPAAKLILSSVADELEPSELVVSSFGIREGLLYHQLTEEERKLDPLVEAARDAGRGLSRFGEHGDLLDRWIAPIFDDPPERARLRLTACLLADVAWQAHPDFRAERGLEMALHGNWVGVDAPERVMIAQALWANFGGGRSLPDKAVAALCTEAELERAALWGLAMRLGQRLSGGLAAALERSRLGCADGTLTLCLRAGEEALYGETVDRRFRRLGSALGCRTRVSTL